MQRHRAPGGLTDLSGHGQALGVGDRGELLVSQPLNGVLVISQIQLGAHQDDGRVGAVVSHLRVPLPRHQAAHTHTHTQITMHKCIYKGHSRWERGETAVSWMKRQSTGAPLDYDIRF